MAVLSLDYAGALERWAAQVRANREQTDRVREAPDGPDFYASVASAFRSDPHRAGDETLDILRSLVQPGETWLDIGAGAGRFALPLALAGAQVVALDPSAAMLGHLHEAVAEHMITGVQSLEGRWPEVAPVPTDVALIAHVGYDVEAIGPFVEAMETSARRLCAAVMFDRTPASVFEPFWPPVHGEERVPLPALFEFLALLVARRRLFSVTLAQRDSPSYPAHDDLAAFARRQLWTQPGSQKDALLLSEVERLSRERDGRVELLVPPRRVAVVAWEPGGPS